MQLLPRVIALTAALSLSLVSLAACGGSGGSDAPGFLPGLGATIASTPNLDGSVDSHGTVVINAGLRVGDVGATNVGNAIRALVSFDLGRLPPGAFITGATLRLYQTQVIGNPYTTVGEVMVEGADVGSSLDASDFQSTQGIPFPLGTLSSDGTIGWKSIDLIAAVGQPWGTGITRVDYRLRINGSGPNLNGVDDQMIFEDSDNSQGTGNVPQLVLTWRLP